MSNYQDWIAGEPFAPGWYIAAVRSNEPFEYYYVLQLWFNPESSHKWFTGGGYVSAHSEPYHLTQNVKFYMTMPTGPENVEHQ